MPVPTNGMRPMVIEPGEGKIPHRLYDLSIEDLEERRAKSFVVPSATEAMNFLGVNSHYFYDRRVPGKKVTSKKDNKKYAVRIEKEKP